MMRNAEIEQDLQRKIQVRLVFGIILFLHMSQRHI